MHAGSLQVKFQGGLAVEVIVACAGVGGHVRLFRGASRIANSIVYGPACFFGSHAESQDGCVPFARSTSVDTHRYAAGYEEFTVLRSGDTVFIQSQRCLWVCMLVWES